MRFIYVFLLGLLGIGNWAQAQTDAPKVMVTGYWNPTGQMIAHFSTDSLLNPEGWMGENWGGFGFNVHSFFPEPYIYTGFLEVDYQNVLKDFYYLVDSLKPLAIISFGAGTGPWEIETGARNVTVWYPDEVTPFYPDPSPPDSTVPSWTVRNSTLPLENIKAAVNNETEILARIDNSNDLGKYLCEYIAYLNMWYHDVNLQDSVFPCIKSGFVHVRADLEVSEAIKAANITVRETLKALLVEVRNVSGIVTFKDSTQSPLGTLVNFMGAQNYSVTVNNADGRYTILDIEPGVYEVKASFGDSYVFDSINVQVDSIQQIDICFENKVDVPENIALKANLLQNYPNPFSLETRIGFSLSQASSITIKVLDLSGRTVQVLCNGKYNSGYQQIVWNGSNASGKSVNSGVYIIQMEAEGLQQHIPCVFIRQ
jgi:pyrrolidone-carboxylate peptidase